MHLPSASTSVFLTVYRNVSWSQDTCQMRFQGENSVGMLLEQMSPSEGCAWSKPWCSSCWKTWWRCLCLPWSARWLRDEPGELILWRGESQSLAISVCQHVWERVRSHRESQVQRHQAGYRGLFQLLSGALLTWRTAKSHGVTRYEETSLASIRPH